MRFFLAGIMQGSHVERAVHGQDYRERIKKAIARHFPQAELYDPRAQHQASLGYGDQTGREVFLRHNRMCREVDVLVAFLPEASMGTAIEMWEAWQAGAAVITISPMVHNWAVRFLSHAIYEDLDALERALADGSAAGVVRRVRGGE